jgi:hypothetical protein
MGAQLSAELQSSTTYMADLDPPEGMTKLQQMRWKRDQAIGDLSRGYTVVTQGDTVRGGDSPDSWQPPTQQRDASVSPAASLYQTPLKGSAVFSSPTAFGYKMQTPAYNDRLDLTPVFARATAGKGKAAPPPPPPPTTFNLVPESGAKLDLGSLKQGALLAEIKRSDGPRRAEKHLGALRRGALLREIKLSLRSLDKGSGDKVVLLVTSAPSSHAQELSQRQMRAILAGKGVTVDEVDGLDPACRSRRA